MIHYHGGPITPVEAAIKAWTARHAMVSFAYPDQLNLAAEVSQSFALDNGAFTAWQNGKQVDWTNYYEWVKQWCRHPGFDFALIPDVIDGCEADNDAYVNAWQFHFTPPYQSLVLGVPVWHLHESLERLTTLMRHWPRVALGSSGDWGTPGVPHWWHRMEKVMDVACDEDGKPRCKLHGLRMLDPTIFSHLPLASADSTNVARNIGIDGAWRGPYSPASKETRALIIAERTERHASAARWNREAAGAQQNLELVG